MRIALVANTQAVGWHALLSGLSRAFQVLGHDCRTWNLQMHPTAERSKAVTYLVVEERELLSFEPELVIVAVTSSPLYSPPWQEWMRLVRRMKGQVFVFGADDPYDQFVLFGMRKDFDRLLTFEPTSIELQSQGIAVTVMPAWCDPWAIPFKGAGERRYGVSHVGVRFFGERKQLLPQLEDLVMQKGKAWFSTHDEKQDWIAGEQLVEVLHQTKILLEIPRAGAALDWKMQTRRSTFTSPRVHLAACAGTFVLHLGAEYGQHTLHGDYPYVRSHRLEDAVEAVSFWLDAPDEELVLVARKNRRDFLERHHPILRAAQILELAGVKTDPAKVHQPWLITGARAAV
jgi:hypothetical protein